MRRNETTDFQSLSLISRQGERKYLSHPERARFYKALGRLDPVSRTFCEMIFWTGCRPSEALAMVAESVDIEAGHVVIRSLKKRGALKGNHFRIVPLPRRFLTRLAKVHRLKANDGADGARRLWPFSRTAGWEHMAAVMASAGITGIRASARGLRHSFGVNAALNGVPETRIRMWMGHANLITTAIYLDTAGLEDRQLAKRMWGSERRDGAENNDAAVTGSEIFRLVTAYTAITATAPRRAILHRIETHADRCTDTAPE